MKEYTIKFDCERKPLTIKGATFAKAVEEYLKTSKFLQYAILVGADLSGAELANADFTGADLSYAALRHANLINADLSHADLSYSDLSYTILGNADLTDSDLRYANLTNADLSYAALRHADLSHADLSYSDLGHAGLSHAILIGANLDFSSLPLNCMSLKMQIDKRIACQLLYHTLSAMQSVADEEVKAILNDDKVLALANQFHMVGECGEIVKEKSNEQKRILSEREKLINSLIFHVYDCMCQDIETETLKQWLDQIQQVIQVEPKDNL